MSSKIKFIDSARFARSSLFNLVDNLTEEIQKSKCKDCNCFLEYESANEKSINCKCLSCNKDYLKTINENLKNRFKNTFKIFNDISKLTLLLRKGVYFYELMNDWSKFNETSFQGKVEVYSNLNMENMTDSDYNDTKRICKDFEIKYLGEYHDLYLRSDTLLFSDVFENFRKMCF